MGCEQLIFRGSEQNERPPESLELKLRFFGRECHGHISRQSSDKQGILPEHPAGEIQADCCSVAEQVTSAQR